VALRFNPPPGWPAPPEGFVPGPGWQPDPGWPSAPPGWQFWVPDDARADPTATGHGVPGSATGVGGAAPEASAGAGAGVLSPAGAGASAPQASAGAGDAAPEARVGAADGTPGTSAEVGYWLPPGAAPSGYGQPPSSGWVVQAQPSSSYRGMAIAAFVLGLLGFFVITAIVGIVLGAVALRGIRRSRQGGDTLAILGIVFGGLWLVVLVALIGIGATSSSPGTSSGSQVPGSQSVPVNSLVVGDCFDLPAPTAPTTGPIGFIEKTPCGQPHNSQVFATFQPSGSVLSYPGTTRLSSLADRGCDARVKANVNSADVTDSMAVRFLFPLKDSWLGGNHTITCIISNSTANVKWSVLKG
jgi:hypothetical protein